MATFKLYRHAISGHSHRVQVFLSLLGLDTQMIDVNLAKGEHKGDAYLKKNGFSQVPVLEITEDGKDITLADSNAILIYLATRFDSTRQWLPEDAEQQAEVQRFLSIASGKVLYGAGNARLVKLFGAAIDYEYSKNLAHGIFSQIEKHLEGKNWLVGNNATIADVANYTYIALAPEGGIDLQPYVNIQNWLKRFENLNGFVAMKSSLVGLNA